MKSPTPVRGTRRDALRKTAILYGALFAAAALLTALLWVFTDIAVGIAFTVLLLLFAAAETGLFFRALLSATRLAAVHTANGWEQAVVTADGCALFFDADAEAFPAAAEAILLADRPRRGAGRKERARLRAEAKRAAAQQGKPLRIFEFTACDAAALTGKTLFLSGTYYRESGGDEAWERVREHNLLFVSEERNG